MLGSLLAQGDATAGRPLLWVPTPGLQPHGRAAERVNRMRLFIFVILMLLCVAKKQLQSHMGKSPAASCLAIKGRNNPRDRANKPWLAE